MSCRWVRKPHRTRIFYVSLPEFLILVHETPILRRHRGNVIPYARNRTLFKRDLARLQLDTPEKVLTVISNGKGAMPRYSDRLTDDDLADVAEFVWQMSEKDWK